MMSDRYASSFGAGPPAGASGGKGGVIVVQVGLAGRALDLDVAAYDSKEMR